MLSAIGVATYPAFFAISVTPAPAGDDLITKSRTTVFPVSFQNTTPSPQQRQHWPSELVNRIWRSKFFSALVSERSYLIRCITEGPGKWPRTKHVKPFGESSHAEVSVHRSPFHRSPIPAVSRGNASPGGPMVRLDAEVQRVDPARRRWLETERPAPQREW